MKVTIFISEIKLDVGLNIKWCHKIHVRLMYHIKYLTIEKVKM